MKLIVNTLNNCSAHLKLNNNAEDTTGQPPPTDDTAGQPPPTEDTTAPPTPTEENVETEMDTDQAQTSETDLDVSIASVEILIPDIPENLNFNLPTNQLL